MKDDSREAEREKLIKWFVSLHDEAIWADDTLDGSTIWKEKYGDRSVDEIIADFILQREAELRNQAENYRLETHRWSKAVKDLEQKIARLESENKDLKDALEYYVNTIVVRADQSYLTSTVAINKARKALSAISALKGKT